MYIARQLSFAGTSFDVKEITLSDDFVDMYNASVQLVCIILRHILYQFLTILSSLFRNFIYVIFPKVLNRLCSKND